MKKILLFISVALIFLANAAFAEVKIAVVDLTKILAGDPQVEATQAKLKKQFEPRSQEVIKAQKALQAEIEKYNRDSSKLKGEELKKEQQRLLAQEKKIQDMREKAQTDLTKAQNQAMQDIFKRIKATVDNIAAKQKFDLVFTKSSAIYNKPEMDITNLVLNDLKK